MTVRIFLLVSAVAQLASPALLPHTQQPEKRNVTDFKNIHDVVEKCISSPSKDFFVDDITHLTEGENACGDRFFCKAHNILHAHRNFCEHTNRDRLVRTLEAYIKNRNVQCDNATTSDEIKMSKVLQSVSRCARQRLFRIPS